MTEAERFMREQMQAQAKRPQPMENTAPTWQGYQTAESQVPEAPMEQRRVTMREAWAHHRKNMRDTRFKGAKGRVSRSEYWQVVIPLEIIGVLVGSLPALIARGSGLILLWVILKLTARRFHDIGFPGGLCLLMILRNVFIGLCLFGVSPFIFGTGALLLSVALLVFMCMPSQPKTNAYGPVPNLK